MLKRKTRKKKAIECLEEAIKAREAADVEEVVDTKVETNTIVYMDEPVWVPPQRMHPSVIKYNNFCEVCNKLEPVSIGKGMLRCIYCNVIAHVHCLKKKQKNFDIRSTKRNWVCFYCVDSLHASRETYDHALSVADKFRRRNEAQIIIAKYWRRYSARRHYVAVYTVIIMLQIQFRVRRRKLQFFMQRQSKIRAIKLKIQTCLNLFPPDRLNALVNGGSSPVKRKDNFFYIIVTLLEMLPYGTKQNWKIFTEMVYAPHSKHGLQHINFDCSILLPGCSGFNIICLTVFQKGNSRDLFLGQTHVFLGENHVWKRGGHFDVTLGDQLYPIQDHIGLELKSEYRFPPCGTISFDIIPSFKMHTECGTVHGTSIEELLRVLNQMPTFDGYVQPATNTNILSKRKGLSGTNSMAPSLANVPLKRMWLVLMEGVAYVYPHFGGPLKLTIAMEWFTSMSSLKDKNIIFKLHHQTYPEFRFMALNNDDVLRWKCAFICCSQYKQFKDKFEMRQLIDEIMKMDISHAKRVPRRNASIVSTNLSAINQSLVPLVHFDGSSNAAAVAAANDTTISNTVVNKVKGLATKVKEELYKPEYKPEEDEFEINYSYKNKAPNAIQTGTSSPSGGGSKTSIGSASLRAQILKKNNIDSFTKLPIISPSKRTTSVRSLQRDNSHGILDVITDIKLKEQLKDQLQDEIKEEYEVDDAIINENVMMIGMKLTEQMLLKGAKKKLKKKKRKPNKMLRKSFLSVPVF